MESILRGRRFEISMVLDVLPEKPVSFDSATKWAFCIFSWNNSSLSKIFGPTTTNSTLEFAAQMNDVINERFDEFFKLFNHDISLDSPPVSI